MLAAVLPKTEFEGRIRTSPNANFTHNGTGMHGLMARTGSFPLDFAMNVLKTHAKANQVVLDPFCGKGTSLLAARLLGCAAFGMDVAPEAVICSAAKQTYVTQFSVLEYVHHLPLTSLRSQEKDGTLWVKDFFDPTTLHQLLSIRNCLFHDLKNGSTRQQQHALITLAALLGILHGHASYSLSVSSAHAYSMAPNYVRRYAMANGLTPPKRDVKGCLSAKLSKVLADPLPPPVRHRITCGSARNLLKEFSTLREQVDLIFTSPPYLNAQTYAKDNWLRHWLLGYDYKALQREYIQTGSVRKFRSEIDSVVSQMSALLKPGGLLICVAGDIRLKSPSSPMMFDTSLLICDSIRHNGSLKIEAVEEVNVASNRRYYHALVKSNGHRKVPLIERTILARRIK